MNGDRSTVVGILGDDPLTSRIMALLLEGAGYEARVLEEDASKVPSASLEGIDLLVCMAPLDGSREEELLLGAMGDHQGAAVPIVRLSTDPEAQRTESVLPWPWSTEALVGAIERALQQFAERLISRRAKQCLHPLAAEHIRCSGSAKWMGQVFREAL